MKQKVIDSERELSKWKKLEKNSLDNLGLREKILLLDVDLATKSMILKKYEDNVKSVNSFDQSKFMNWVKDVTMIPFNKSTPLPVTISDGSVSIKNYLENIKTKLNTAVSGHDHVKDEIVDYVARMISNPSGKGNIIALCGEKGTGKCHGKGVPILMYDGSVKNVEDILVDDVIMGDDLKPRKVLSTTTGIDDLYKVTQSHGMTYTVNSQHPLCLKYTRLPNLSWDENAEKFHISWIEDGTFIKKRSYDIQQVALMRSFWKHIQRVPDNVVHIIASEFISMSSGTRTFLKGYRLAWSPKVNNGNYCDYFVQVKDKEDTYYFHPWVTEVIEALKLSVLDEEHQIVYKKGLTDALKDFRLNINNKIEIQSNIELTPIGVGKYYGFEIGGNHRYLLEDGTVTHNTRLIKQGVAEALNRPFHIINMGGCNDSHLFLGHDPCYTGASYGRIAQILISSKVSNPVIYLDELDKVESGSEKGMEIYRVLTNLLDEEQNSEFMDEYFSGVKLDLSKILWVASMNDAALVDPILRDRLKIINLKSLDKKNKIEIFKNYMLPELTKMVGMNLNDVFFSDDIISYIISKTPEEPGCRQLKKRLETIIQKINTMKITETGIFAKENNQNDILAVTKDNIDKFLKSMDLSENLSHLSMYS